MGSDFDIEPRGIDNPKRKPLKPLFAWAKESQQLLSDKSKDTLYKWIEESGKKVRPAEVAEIEKVGLWEIIKVYGFRIATKVYAVALKEVAPEIIKRIIPSWVYIVLIVIVAGIILLKVL